MSATGMDRDRPQAATTKYECRICWYVYDPAEGDVQEQVPSGTAFADLPPHWRCPQCDAERHTFLVMDA